MTASCIYGGIIRHRRIDPPREFSHRLAPACVDLDELPTLLARRLQARGPGALRFRRRDYLGPISVLLREAVTERVAELSGSRPDGPIRLLTHLRSFGLCFNPVSFYYCFDAAGRRVRAVPAEVTNTPWGERRELIRTAVARMTARYPLASVRVLTLIYAHALGLKLAGAAVHPRPRAAAR